MPRKRIASIPLTHLMPGLTDRAAFVGQTGTGKTTLAEYLLRLRPFVVALDPKGVLDWSGYAFYTTLPDVVTSTATHMIYRPVYTELQDAQTMDQFFEWIYRRKHTTLYIDEIYAVAKGDTYPFHLGAAITRGREVGVVVYSATQRPARIPQIVLSESEHMYIFRLKLPQDRQRMMELTGLDAESFVLPKHQFWYAPQDAEPVGPLKLQLGERLVA